MMKSFKRPVTYFLNSIFQKCYLTHRGCCCQAVALGDSEGRVALSEGDSTLLQLKNTSRTLYVRETPHKYFCTEAVEEQGLCFITSLAGLSKWMALV